MIMISAVSNNSQKQSFGSFFAKSPEIIRKGELEIKQFKNRAGLVRKVIATDINGSVFKSFRNSQGKPVKTVFWSKIGDEAMKIVTTFNRNSEVKRRVTKINGKVTEISR